MLQLDVDIPKQDAWDPEIALQYLFGPSLYHIDPISGCRSPDFRLENVYGECYIEAKRFEDNNVERKLRKQRSCTFGFDRERPREAISDKNSQCKRYITATGRHLPLITVLLSTALTVYLGSVETADVVYGKPALIIQPYRDWSYVKPTIQLNGAFRPDQNTTTSAVGVLNLRFEYGGWNIFDYSLDLYPNPFSSIPLPMDLFLTMENVRIMPPSIILVGKGII